MEWNKKIFGGISREEFLRDYWQKKPLFVKGAFPNFENPVEPDELAGMACEESVVSRIVSGDGDPKNWKLSYGPYEPEEMSALSEENWTLLVQQVEPWFDEVAALKRPFDFIPSWRSDDVMVSFAARNGSVGPHMDNYDVFLIQGMGSRLWKVGGEAVEREDLVEDCEVKILKNYETHHEWLAEPGDLLYIPPKYVHYGVAQEACMTYSVGYRAPNYYELLSSFLEAAKDELESKFYEDTDLEMQSNTGEIQGHVMQKVEDAMMHAIVTSELLPHWFGKLVTENRRIVEETKLEVPFDEKDYFLQELNEAGEIRFNEQVRTSYYVDEERDQVLFFAGGTEYIFGKDLLPFLQQVTDKWPVEKKEIALNLKNNSQLELLISFANEGILYLPEDSDEDFEDDED